MNLQYRIKKLTILPLTYFWYWMDYSTSDTCMVPTELLYFWHLYGIELTILYSWHLANWILYTADSSTFTRVYVPISLFYYSITSLWYRMKYSTIHFLWYRMNYSTINSFMVPSELPYYWHLYSTEWTTLLLTPLWYRVNYSTSDSSMVPSVLLY